jgi:hypothetical protein
VTRTVTPPEVRFARLVDRSGGPGVCHEWTGGTNDAGYGVFHPSKGETVGAHRYALEQHLGRPLVGWALHECDNPPCVNTGPGHVYEGDSARNVADMHERGRNPRRGRLSDEEVRSLREQRAAGEPLLALAAQYGLAVSAVSMIVRGLRWPEAGGPIQTERKYVRGR